MDPQSEAGIRKAAEDICLVVREWAEEAINEDQGIGLFACGTYQSSNQVWAQRGMPPMVLLGTLEALKHSYLRQMFDEAEALGTPPSQPPSGSTEPPVAFLEEWPELPPGP